MNALSIREQWNRKFTMKSIATNTLRETQNMSHKAMTIS